MVSALKGGSGKGLYVGYRTQVPIDEAYTDIVFSATDNRVHCPHCNGTKFEVKGTHCVDDGELPTWMDGYGAAGTKDMIIFLCHCGREFALNATPGGDDWAAQAAT